MTIDTMKRPWALHRMRPLTPVAPDVVWPTSMAVDPDTQLGVYYDIDGTTMAPMASGGGKHGTTDTNTTPYPTPGTGDGSGGNTDTDTQPDTFTD